MKLLALKCPECMANLKIEEGRTSCFCEYCGCKIIIDDENEEITINKNVTINKTITETKRLINDAQLIRAQNEEKENKRGYIALAICWGAILLVFLGIWLGFFINSKAAESQGKISAGYHSELEGQDYKAVEAHLEAAGFTNIQLVDLNDSGFAFWNSGKVSQVSIGGKANFEEHNYFAPETKVVISYH